MRLMVRSRIAALAMAWLCRKVLFSATTEWFRLSGQLANQMLRQPCYLRMLPSG